MSLGKKNENSITPNPIGLSRGRFVTILYWKIKPKGIKRIQETCKERRRRETLIVVLYRIDFIVNNNSTYFVI